MAAPARPARSARRFRKIGSGVTSRSGSSHPIFRLISIVRVLKPSPSGSRGRQSPTAVIRHTRPLLRSGQFTLPRGGLPARGWPYPLYAEEEHRVTGKGSPVRKIDRREHKLMIESDQFRYREAITDTPDIRVGKHIG